MKYYVVVDLEMCSGRPKKSYPYKHEIIQIGAALLDENLEIVDKYSGFVKPEIGALDDFISKLTGITSKDLKDAPHVEQEVKDKLGYGDLIINKTDKDTGKVIGNIYCGGRDFTQKKSDISEYK